MKPYKEKYTKKEKTGDVYVNVFSDGNNIVKEYSDKDSYDSLKNSNQSNPSKSGYQWIYSYSTIGVGYPLREINEGEYVEDDSSIILMANGVTLSLSKNDVKDGVMSDEAISKIENDLIYK